MGLREKLMLYDMVYYNIVNHTRIARGSSKSILPILYGCNQRALMITNYILASIDEELETRKNHFV